LLSHSVPSGDLAALVERAFDALIAQETKRRMGAGKPRKRRALAPGSRHVPVEVARLVWERDGGQCAFVDGQGRRCSARRFLTLEHREPHALGGPPTVDNVCLYCAGHNAEAARNVFGEDHVDAKIAKQKQRRTRTKARADGDAPERRDTREDGDTRNAREDGDACNARDAREDGDAGATGEPRDAGDTSAAGSERPDASNTPTPLPDDIRAKVAGALRTPGFREVDVRRALAELRDQPPDLESYLRAALAQLMTKTPKHAPLEPIGRRGVAAAG
jgi:hypothetical protein